MRCFLRPALAAAFVLPVLFGTPAFALDATGDFITKWDPDHDGTIDQNEIDKAADAAFDKLDTDHDGTLDLKELGNRVTKAEFNAADPDHDGTLDKGEFRALAHKRFAAADPDHDGTLDQKELASKAGQRLRHLVD